jgi:hypothetical protein
MDTVCLKHKHAVTAVLTVTVTHQEEPELHVRIVSSPSCRLGTSAVYSIRPKARVLAVSRDQIFPWTASN